MDKIKENIEILRARLHKKNIKVNIRDRNGKVYATLSMNSRPNIKCDNLLSVLSVPYEIYRSAMNEIASDLFPKFRLTSFGGTAVYRLNP